MGRFRQNLITMSKRVAQTSRLPVFQALLVVGNKLLGNRVRSLVY